MGMDAVSETEADSVNVDETDVVIDTEGVVERDVVIESDTETDEVSSIESVAVFLDREEVPDTDHVLEPIEGVVERVWGMEADEVVEGDDEGDMDCDWVAEADIDAIEKDCEADGARVVEGDKEGVGSDDEYVRDGDGETVRVADDECVWDGDGETVRVADDVGCMVDDWVVDRGAVFVLDTVLGKVSVLVGARDGVD